MVRTEEEVALAEWTDIPGGVLGTAAENAERIALRGHVERKPCEISYCELARLATRFARGVVSLGIGPGDRVLVIADNSPRWIVADLGIMLAGAVTVHRGADVTPEETAYMARHSGARALVAGTRRVLALVADSTAGIETRMLLEGDAAGALTFDDVLSAGDSEPAIDLPSAEDPSRLATIVYTSGTTGPPKGVMLTHGNVLHNMRVLPEVLDIDRDERFLCVLPSWHMFERTVEYTALTRGSVLVYSSLRRLKKDLAAERPTYLAAVPRLWEGVLAGFESRSAEKGAVLRALARMLRGQAEVFAMARSRLRGRVHLDASAPRPRLPAWLGLALSAPLGLLGRKLLGGSVRAALGGEIKVGVSGGGRLPLNIDRFLSAMGVTLIVGYGLSETSPVVALRDIGENVLGTIGRAIPETEVRISDEAGDPLPVGETGEVWVRGPQVMKGYYEDPDATAAVMRKGGWLRTGDLCSLTARGDLVFRGRIKDTIVLAGGENIEPGPIESRILESPFVRQAVVVGQDRKTLAALLVPDSDASAREAVRRRVDVREFLKAEVHRLVTREAGFHARELIPRVAVLDQEFTVEDGTLTATQKLKRNVILDRYRDLVEGLYRD